MLVRCIELYKINPNRVIFIKPSISEEKTKSLKMNNISFESKKTRLLLLSGWQLNKNIMKVPEIAFELKKKNIEFEFVITAPKDNSKYQKDFNKLVTEYDVENFINHIGTISNADLPSLYCTIDYVFLMSKVESFSNNIIEAWTFERPLFISNAEWARDICKNAAIYVNRDSAPEIAQIIINAISEKKIIKEVVDNGKEQLRTYPSINEKTIEEIKFLNKIYECKNFN